MKIREMAMMFEGDAEGATLWRESEKLMKVIKEQILEFVNIFAKATILFYQLDVRKGQTTMICLQNLVTSITLKNPIYTKLIEVFRASLKPKIQKFEASLDSLKD
jgi:hypothetical protein